MDKGDMQMKGYRMLLAAVLLGVLILTSPVSLVLAEDFTFNIPVELSGLPSSVCKAKVAVYVYDDSASPLSSVDHIIGMGSAEADIHGKLVQTLTVKFNALPGKQAGKAIYYYAPLYLLYNSDGACLNGSYMPVDIVMALDGPIPYDSTKPYVRDTRGSIYGPAPTQPARAPKLDTPRPLAPKADGSVI